MYVSNVNNIDLFRYFIRYSLKLNIARSRWAVVLLNELSHMYITRYVECKWDNSFSNTTLECEVGDTQDLSLTVEYLLRLRD